MEEKKKRYVCERGHEFDERAYGKHGGICPEDGSLLMPMSEEEVGAAPGGSCREVVCGEEGSYGVGVFVFDFSGSMLGELRAEDPHTKITNITKIEIVANAFGNMIAELTQGASAIGAPDKLYLSLIGFSESAWHIGTYRLDQMIKENYERTFKYWRNFVLQEQTKGEGSTNITAGLRIARDIYDAICSGDMQRLQNEFGFDADFDGVGHSIIRTIRIPDIRFLVVSDGEHCVGPFVNYLEDVKLTDCKGLVVNGVMSVFIGPANSRGDQQMEEIAGVCPIHNVKGKITLSKFTNEGYGGLRSLLSAFSRSGFCLQCL